MTFLEYFWNTLKKSFKNILKYLKNYLYYLVCVKNFPKNAIFKVFQIHLQVVLLLNINGYKSFYITFEGPNVNEIISYFENL
jgi:hypothetical protein